MGSGWWLTPVNPILEREDLYEPVLYSTFWGSLGYRMK